MDSTKAIAEYHPIEVALAQLEDQYGATVWVCNTPERLSAAKASHKEIRQWRLALEEERKRLKADVLERGRQIDGEAKRIAARIALVEDPCVAAIRAEEDKKRREEEAAQRAEQDRIDRCRAEIDRIRGIPVSLTVATAAQIDAAANELEQLDITWLDEFADAASATRDETLSTLGAMRRAALSREEESARLAEERAELERLRAEKEAREAEEREKREAEERACREKIEREEREARERIAAEERASREARYKADAEARALRAKQDEDARCAREAEEQRQRKERERLEAERRARDEAEREQRLKETEQQDARAMLTTFVELYGELEEFGLVVAAIRGYFASRE